MYKRCPKCGFEHAQYDPKAGSCAACGVIYAKWLTHFLEEEPVVAVRKARPKGELTESLVDFFLHVPDRWDTVSFGGRVALYILFVIWGCRFMAMDIDGYEIGSSFMHRVDLIFHEAGHVIFRAFGEFMTILGGSLGQLLMPAVALVVLLFQNRDPFGASIALWWLAQSFMDLAPYIDDARALQLPLLGGGTGADRPGMHDWNNILSELDWLEYDHALAKLADRTGVVLMVLAFAWGAAVLVRHSLTRPVPVRARR